MDQSLSRRSVLAGIAGGTAASGVALMTGVVPRFAIAQTAGGKVMYRGNGSEPETLDPHKSSGVPESFIQFDLFDGLLIPDGKGGLVPGAAERWEVSEDGTVYTFHLRRNARWSDGTPVTAEDWVFSWKRLLDPRTAAKYAYYLWPVLNAEDASLGRKPMDSVGLAAPDTHTFQVTLRGPTPYFLKMLHHHAAYALSKANLEQHGDTFIRPGNLVSNGAYMLVEAVPQSHVKLVKNPHYWDAENVRIDTVMFLPTENLDAELRRFRSGELDFTYEVPLTQTDWVKANLPDEYRETPYFGTYFFAPNMTKEPWKSNRDLRMALNLAIDRASICEKITRQGEQPAYAFTPPGVEGYPLPLPDHAAWTQEQRDAKARELMQKAGYGKGGKPLDLEVLYNTSENHRKVAIAVASMWQQKLGIKVTLNNQEWKVFLDSRDEKKFKDVTRHGWIGDFVDPNTFLELLRSDIGKQNPSGYANPEYDRLMMEANRTQDPETRAALMRQAESIALEDAAVFPIYTYAAQHMVAKRVLNWGDDLLDNHPTRWLDLKA
ncbi:peptide ABC transporter substrate-binding protein [Rhodospirillum centenum]|uniref:Periplasmic oligopeptide-binding protein n=1 Tax=Rhodospirillum centenum (strain ATCC 51521 / SW) TaxID=414684 RepID=B6IP97_RHOCS|nr:peptide ABC transporter substrate-binding protein [Rhodospirillum centenum]ACI99599.1 periplasmic oligopeptide-binding protein [Rhodospirillum centenum SW]